MIDVADERFKEVQGFEAARARLLAVCESFARAFFLELLPEVRKLDDALNSVPFTRERGEAFVDDLFARIALLGDEAVKFVESNRDAMRERVADLVRMIAWSEGWSKPREVPPS